MNRTKKIGHVKKQKRAPNARGRPRLEYIEQKLLRARIHQLRVPQKIRRQRELEGGLLPINPRI